MAKARLNPSRERTPAAQDASVSPGHESPAETTLAPKSFASGLALKDQEREDQPGSNQARNGHALNGAYKNGHDRAGGATNGHYHDSNSKDEVRTLIRTHRLDAANRVVMALLDQRIAAGDSELCAATMLLQHYYVILCRQPPLTHVGTRPLLPNDRLYACFDQFIDLIRQQQSQVSELQAIIAELL